MSSIPVGDVGDSLKGDTSRTQRAVKAWWGKRITEVEAFLEARMRGEHYQGFRIAARRRPAFRDVLNLQD